jgi:SET family sugar efflux transporter-like MFS transporter
LLLGAAEAITGPYIVLFGADRAHLSSFQIGIFMSLWALSSMAMSMWLGRQYDLHPGRRPLVISLVAATTGYLLLTTTTSYMVLLLIAVTLLGFAGAAFPQIFTLAHGYLGEAAFSQSSKRTAMMRSVWSIAWAIGPVIGGLVLVRYGFSALFLVTGSLFFLVNLPVALLGKLPARETKRDEGQEQGQIGPLLPMVISVSLFHIAMFSGSVVLPPVYDQEPQLQQW